MTVETAHTAPSGTPRASARTIGLAGLLGAATAVAAWLLAAAVIMAGLVVGLGMKAGFAGLVVVWIVGALLGVGLLWLVSRVLDQLGVAHPIGATLTGVAVTAGLFAAVAYLLPQMGDSPAVVGVVLGLGVAMVAFALAARWAHRARALGALAALGGTVFVVATLISW